MKRLVSIEDLGRDEARALTERTSELASDTDRGSWERCLRGRTVASLFFEPSTRTRLSFELAAKHAGAHVVTHHPETSSTMKGESLRDTVSTVHAMGADILVVRHAENGIPECCHQWTGAPVVSAGDGNNEHPTQALLDAAALNTRFGGLEGLQVGLVGDVAHSRVAGSLLKLFPMLGAEVRLIGPPGFLPEGEASPPIDDVIGELDVVYLLRIQKERGALAGPTYEKEYRLDEKRSRRMKPDGVVMHPGPVNRGVEITSEVADGPRSMILDQVRHGVPARYAVLESLARGMS